MICLRTKYTVCSCLDVWYDFCLGDLWHINVLFAAHGAVAFRTLSQKLVRFIIRGVIGSQNAQVLAYTVQTYM